MLEDLADGWTLAAQDWLSREPAKLRLIGREGHYLVKLCGYQLPQGGCVCGEDPCVCSDVKAHGLDEPWRLTVISAKRRTPSDGTDDEVARLPRYYEPFSYSPGRLDLDELEVMIARWDRAHRIRAASKNPTIERWMQLNTIRGWVARESGAIVRLADHPWDPVRLREGQLVLVTDGPSATATASAGYVYRLPNLDVPLRVEDVGQTELLIDCGEEDLVRVEEYLLRHAGRPLRLTIDREETDKQIGWEHWTLQQAQEDKRLCLLISHPKLAWSSPERAVESFFDPELDPGQQQAVRAALAADDVLVVQGPPGTGKTTAICEIIRQYLDRDPGLKIVLGSQTHQAVDNVLLRLTKADPDLPIARVASESTAGKIHQMIRERYWVGTTEPWEPPVVHRALAYRKFIRAQTRAGDRETDEVTTDVLRVQENYLASIGPQRTLEEKLAQARVIAGTCAAISSKELRDIEFGVAILEEAGKATPADSLTVMLRARKTILVGDTRQLPPHIWRPMREALRKPHTLKSKNPNHDQETSEIREMIQALGSTEKEREAADAHTLFAHFAERLHGTAHETTLPRQYRMLPEIGELVSHAFYQDIGGLEHGREEPIDPRVAAFAGDVRVRLLDLPGREQHERKSAMRIPEVDYIRRELKALNQTAASVAAPPDGPERLGVAVITPYTAQARQFEARLDLTQYPALHVRIGIVDRFQGDEDQVVLLSMAATTSPGFLEIPNRINVAVSRAQDLLVIATSLPAAMKGRIGPPFQTVVKFIDQQVKLKHAGYEIIRPTSSPHRGRRGVQQPGRVIA
ncbi:MAG TPA: AAA domain-containing protein [Solirubrobacteraceae bacterium]